MIHKAMIAMLIDTPQEQTVETMMQMVSSILGQSAASVEVEAQVQQEAIRAPKSKVVTKEIYSVASVNVNFRIMHAGMLAKSVLIQFSFEQED